MWLRRLSPGATPAWLRGLVPAADLLLLLVDLDTDPTADLESVRSELAALHVIPRPPGRAEGERGTVESRPALVVGTKVDLAAADDGAELLHLELQDRLPLLLTSALSGAGLDALRKRIVEALDVVRVYAKPPGRPPELNRPFVLRRGATVEDLADSVHHELRRKSSMLCAGQLTVHRCGSHSATSYVTATSSNSMPADPMRAGIRGRGNQVPVPAHNSPQQHSAHTAHNNTRRPRPTRLIRIRVVVAATPPRATKQSKTGFSRSRCS